VSIGDASYDVDLSQYQLDGPVVAAQVTPVGGVAEKVLVQVFNKTNLGFTVQFVGTLVCWPWKRSFILFNPNNAVQG